jgi:glycosyltransferase involved in cell wall biosynthesis
VNGRNIFLADTPDSFAGTCLQLLDSEPMRKEVADSAWQMVAADFSWESASRIFETILEKEAPSLR